MPVHVRTPACSSTQQHLMPAARALVEQAIWVEEDLLTGGQTIVR